MMAQYHLLIVPVSLISESVKDTFMHDKTVPYLCYLLNQSAVRCQSRGDVDISNFIIIHLCFITHICNDLDKHHSVFKLEKKKKKKKKTEAHVPQCSPECTAMKAIFSQNTVNVACKN